MCSRLIHMKLSHFNYIAKQGCIFKVQIWWHTVTGVELGT